MALRRDSGHGGPLAPEQDTLRDVLVLLMGERVAAGEHGTEEQHDAEERDADPSQVSERPHGATMCGPHLLGTGFRHPAPSSSQHRFPLHLFLPPDHPPKISLCSPVASPSGGALGGPAGAVRPRSRPPEAAAGPAPETGGGTEEVPKAGPGGGPPSDLQWRLGCDGS